MPPRSTSTCPTRYALELDLAQTDVAMFGITDDELVVQLAQIQPHPDRDSVFDVERRVMSAELAASVAGLRHTFASARPLTRYMTLVQSCRSLIFSGYLDEATDVLDELEQFTAPFDSNMMTTIINEIRAQFCRANGDFEQAAQLLDDVVRRRSGYLELSNMNLLARFHALSMHVHNGDPVPAAEVRHSWDLLERHGRGPQSFRAASATAIGSPSRINANSASDTSDGPLGLATRTASPSTRTNSTVSICPSTRTAPTSNSTISSQNSTSSDPHPAPPRLPRQPSPSERSYGADNTQPQAIRASSAPSKRHLLIASSAASPRAPT